MEKDKKIVKGWKCFNKDLCCEPTSDVCFEFEVGKTYSVDGKLEMCKNGFHFHTNTKDLFEYYNFYNKPRVCEIEAINVIIENNKSVCKTIKIIKELTWDEVLSLVNSGDYNSGYRNSGYWNSCNKESGFFNSRISEEIRIFNKPCLCKIWESCIKPSFIYFGLDRWISSERMSPKEKKEYPDYIITDGYLKELDYKEAWLESAKSAMDRSDWDKQLKLLQGLPNFDWDVFEEISGLSKEFLTEK